MNFGYKSVGRGADDHRAGRVHERRRAAGRPRARQEHDARVGSGLRPRHPFVARRRPDVRRLVSRESQQQLSRARTRSAASPRYEAGTPLLYTRSIGDPQLDFFHARIGAYFQDDIRVKKGLTLSPGRALQLPDARGRHARRSSRASASPGRRRRAARRRCARAAGSSTAGSIPASGGRPSASTASISATSSSPIRRIPIRAPAACFRRRTPTGWASTSSTRTCGTAPASTSGSRRAPASTCSTTTTIRISCRAATNLNPLVERRPARSGVTRTSSSTVTDAEIRPARGVRQLQRQSRRAGPPRRMPRSSTGAGWR